MTMIQFVIATYSHWWTIACLSCSNGWTPLHREVSPRQQTAYKTATCESWIGMTYYICPPPSLIVHFIAILGISSSRMTRTNTKPFFSVSFYSYTPHLNHYPPSQQIQKDVSSSPTHQRIHHWLENHRRRERLKWIFWEATVHQLSHGGTGQVGTCIERRSFAAKTMDDRSIERHAHNWIERDIDDLNEPRIELICFQSLTECT